MAKILFEQTLIMYFMMLIGALCYKAGLITNQGSKEMGRLLVTAVLPCVIIRSFLIEFSIERLTNLGVMFLLSPLAIALSIVIARCTFKKGREIEHFGVAFSNAGFMGIPLAQALFGAGAVYYVAVFVAWIGILQWTYGVMVMTGSKRSVRIRTILTNPVVLGTVAGMLIYITRVPIPNVLARGTSFIADLNTPLGMIVLGVYLAQTNLLAMLKDSSLYVATLVRLIGVPLLTMVLLGLLPIGSMELKLTTLVVASTPIGANVAVFAQINDKDYTRAVQLVCLSTLLSIITLPLLFMLVERVFT